jgi:hypothetical protein
VPPVHLRSNRRVRRFTKQQRLDRICKRIYHSTVQRRPLTIRQIARFEGISVGRTRYYIHLLNKSKELRRLRASIQRVGKRYLYVVTPEVERPKPFAPEKGDLVVRGYVNYEGQYRSRSIDINCVAVTPHDWRLPIQQDPAVIANMQIRNVVRDHFGDKLAGMLKFGIEEVTADSHNRYQYKHGGGSWIDF